MTDKLKALALAAAKDWLPNAWHNERTLNSNERIDVYDAAYIAAASPDAILALIKAKEDAEADKSADQYAIDKLTEETQQLRAEVERLNATAKIMQDLHEQDMRERNDLLARVNAMGSQEPVAWIECEWSGTGQKKLHFERSQPTVRDEVTNPVWTPLYLAPGAAPKEQK